MRRVFNLAIDLITGFDINKKLKESLDFDYFSREEITEYQKQKFKTLVESASNSVFYKNYTGSTINQFPLIERETYTKNHSELLTNKGNIFAVVNSSGSTSNPVSHLITKEMLLMKRVSHQKMLKWHGLDRESKEIKIGGLPVSLKTKFYYLIKGKLYFNSHGIGEKNIDNLIKKYNRFKPKVLYGYPSAIQYFLKLAGQRTSELYHPALIVMHAENLYQEIIDNLNQVFPEARVANQYWATEGNIAETCPKGNLHINEDSIICEVFNEDEDGVGDIYITNLHSFALPIIRYKLGDRIKLSKKICSCGRNTRIIEKIEGRNHEFLTLPDGRKFPFTAIGFSKFPKNITSFQIVYYPKQGKILFKYIPEKRNITIDKQEITKYFKQDLGIDCETEEVNSIECTKAGKFKRFIVIE